MASSKKPTKAKAKAEAPASSGSTDAFDKQLGPTLEGLAKLGPVGG